MQHEAALHFHDDVGQFLRVRSKLIGRLVGGSGGKSSVQRALKLKWSGGVSNDSFQFHKYALIVLPAENFSPGAMRKSAFERLNP